MKKTTLITAAVLLAIGLTACGNNEEQAANGAAQTMQAESSQEAEQAETNESVSDTTDEIAEAASSEVTESAGQNGKTLVVYFSAT